MDLKWGRLCLSNPDKKRVCSSVEEIVSVKNEWQSGDTKKERCS